MRTAAVQTEEVQGLDDWLRITVCARGYDWEWLHQAMIADDFSPAQARYLIASSWLRHSEHPLETLPGTPKGRLMLEWLRRSAGDMASAAHSTPRAAQPDLLQPSEAAGHSLAGTERPVRILFTARQPEIALLGEVLSDKECAELIALGEQQRDGRARGNGSAAVNRLELRLAALAGWPAERCGPLSVLCSPSSDAARTAARQPVASFIVSLSNVAAGGATRFPQLGLTMHPRRGNAIYFACQHGNGHSDASTAHVEEPVRDGVKWVATLQLIGKPDRANA